MWSSSAYLLMNLRYKYFNFIQLKPPAPVFSIYFIKLFLYYLWYNSEPYLTFLRTLWLTFVCCQQKYPLDFVFLFIAYIFTLIFLGDKAWSTSSLFFNHFEDIDASPPLVLLLQWGKKCKDSYCVLFLQLQIVRFLLSTGLGETPWQRIGLSQHHLENLSLKMD